MDADIRIGAKRKRAHPDDIPWTAARCNRLLRTITSRISILRRIAASKQPSSRIPSYSVPVELKRNSPAVHLDKHSPSNSGITKDTLSSLRDDPEWLQNSQNKPVFRTYTCKARGLKFNDHKAGESASKDVVSSFRTPFIKRILRPSSSTSPWHAISPSQLYPKCGAAERKRRTRELPVKSTSSADEAYRNLITALENLLTTTTPLCVPPMIGARSLFNTCLRKVPEYIQIEQKSYDCEAEDGHFDVTSEIYSELENLGARDNGGWTGLRGLVREHGVKLISDAIREGLIPRKVVESLLEVCQKCRASIESRTLLRAELHGPRTSNSERVENFMNLSHRYQAVPFSFQELARSLEIGELLPVDINQTSVFWQEVMSSLLIPSRRDTAAQLIETYAVACVKFNRQDTGSSPSPNLLTKMACILISLVVATVHTNLKSDLARMLHCVATNALLSLDSHSASMKQYRAVESASDATYAQSFLLSSVLLQALGIGTDPFLEFLSMDTLICELNLIRTPEDNGSKFISSITKCLSHTSEEASREITQNLICQVVECSNSASAISSDFLKTLALESASGYAGYHNDKQSHSFAEEIENRIFNSEQSSSLQTPSAGSRQKRYRWEEGLCEWILSTPLDIARIDKTEGAARQDSPEVEDSQDSGICLDFDTYEAALDQEQHLRPTASVKVTVSRDYNNSDQDNRSDDDADDCDELALVSAVEKEVVQARDFDWDDYDELAMISPVGKQIAKERDLGLDGCDELAMATFPARRIAPPNFKKFYRPASQNLLKDVKAPKLRRKMKQRSYSGTRCLIEDEISDDELG